MLWIQNRRAMPGEGPDGVHLYTVRVNQSAPMAYFLHERSTGAAECFRRAAEAVDDYRGLSAPGSVPPALHWETSRALKDFGSSLEELNHALLTRRARLRAGRDSLLVVQRRERASPPHVWLAVGDLAGVEWLFRWLLLEHMAVGETEISFEGRRGWARLLHAREPGLWSFRSAGAGEVLATRTLEAEWRGSILTK